MAARLRLFHMRGPRSYPGQTVGPINRKEQCKRVTEELLLCDSEISPTYSIVEEESSGLITVLK